MSNQGMMQAGRRTPDDQVFEPLREFGEIAGIISAVISVITTIVAIAEFIALTDPETAPGTIEAIRSFISGNTIAVGFGVGLVTLIVGVTIIEMFRVDRCNDVPGDPECVAGLVVDIVGGFKDETDDLFPFTATHDRADLLAKSRYWEIIERYNAFVYYTEHEDFSQRSELLRCYFYSDKTCRAINDALGGAWFGGILGTVLDTLIGMAVPACTNPFTCLLFLVVLAVVAAICVLAGALIGGQIGKANAQNNLIAGETPEGNILPLTVGDYASIKGNLVNRNYDNYANVFWWVDPGKEKGELEVYLSGRAPQSIIDSPFYEDVDEDFPEDSCS